MFTVPKFGPESGLAAATEKLCVTEGAAAYTVLPDCVAWIVQVPGTSSVANESETVQMVGVVEL
jgi:hypothetical protein